MASLASCLARRRRSTKWLTRCALRSKLFSHARVITIGSSMGGYAAVRAGLALGAEVAVGFSPQVLIDPSARKAARLGHMHFDDVLSWLRIVAAVEGHQMTSLVDAASDAAKGWRRSADAATVAGTAMPTETRVVLHVGASDAGDVYEAELLSTAIDAARRKHGGGGPRVALTVHANRDHNLVVDLRNDGQLVRMLQDWIKPTHSEMRIETEITATLEMAAAAVGPLEVNAQEGDSSTTVAGRSAARRAAAGDHINLLKLAHRAMADGAAREALECADDAIRDQPRSADAWMVRASALIALCRYVDAHSAVRPRSRCRGLTSKGRRLFLPRPQKGRHDWGEPCRLWQSRSGRRSCEDGRRRRSRRGRHSRRQRLCPCARLRGHPEARPDIGVRTLRADARADSGSIHAVSTGERARATERLGPPARSRRTTRYGPCWRTSGSLARRRSRPGVEERAQGRGTTRLWPPR